MQCLGIATPEVTEKSRLGVPFNEVLLLTAETGRPAEKNSSSTFAGSKPEMSPQSKPIARAAIIPEDNCHRSGHRLLDIERR